MEKNQIYNAFVEAGFKKQADFLGNEETLRSRDLGSIPLGRAIAILDNLYDYNLPLLFKDLHPDISILINHKNYIYAKKAVMDYFNKLNIELPYPRDSRLSNLTNRVKGILDNLREQK